MKLFVWSNPYHVKYGSSMVFAIAENVDEARNLAKTGKSYAYNEYEQKTVPQDELKEPTRIVDLPCAEWHEWSE